MFVRPHGIACGEDGCIYCTDDGSHTVRKFTLQGKLQMEIGVPGRAGGMPERSHAKNFNRKLVPAEAQNLATAGNGSKTEGFINLLAIYGELHHLGYRCDMKIGNFIIYIAR